MCGIVGIISKNKIQKGIVEKMADAIAHRGPDGCGYYYGDNFAFGHRRLSIIDLSEDGAQPMTYMDRYVITYNGEIYNFIELKEELITYGYIFTTQTDTEVILASFDKWGEKCVERFNGMWAFAIYDKKTNIIFCSRDRFGVKPFYYYKTQDTFIFGSEIKAILEYPELDITPNIDFLNLYLKNGAIEYTKDTAFTGIYRFDFASYFIGNINDLFDNFSVCKFYEVHPNLSYETFDKNQAKKYAQIYYDLLEDAVRLRLRADVKVGSALSGGLDSSSIVYIVNKLLKNQNKSELQETFSSIYKSNDNVKDCDESYFIDLLAKTLNIHSNQIEPNIADVPREHYKVINAMENPPESTCMSNWHTFKLVASTDVKVTLDGQGADEHLAGYTPYFMSYLSSLDIIDLFKESIKFLQVPNTKKTIIRSICIGIFRNIFGEKYTRYVLFKLHKKIDINLNQQLANDINGNLITLIHYADHTSMAHSIESRMPFMDYRIVDFLASVPSCYKMHNGWTKYIARLAFDKKLPDEIVWRKDKMGWPIPELYWFNGKLKSYFYDNILENNLLSKLDIKHSLDSTKKFVNITKSIRFLNVAIFDKIFFTKNNKDVV